MNTESFDLVPVENDARVVQGGPGAWCWKFNEAGRRFLCCKLPSGSVAVLPVQRGGEDSGWHWDGDEQRPTLSPSILQRDDEPTPGRVGWHGFLQAGRLVSC